MRELTSSLARSLTNHKPDENQVAQIERVREAADDFCKVLDFTLPSYDPDNNAYAAYGSLEECVMWAVKAIVLEQKDPATADRVPYESKMMKDETGIVFGSSIWTAPIESAAQKELPKLISFDNENATWEERCAYFTEHIGKRVSIRSHDETLKVGILKSVGISTAHVNISNGLIFLPNAVDLRALEVLFDKIEE